MGGVDLVLLLLWLSVLAGGTGINNAGLAAVGDMAASKANGRPAIAAGVLCWGALPDISQRLTGRCLRGAWVLLSILLLISLIRLTTNSKSVPRNSAHIICSYSSLIL